MRSITTKQLIFLVAILISAQFSGVACSDTISDGYFAKAKEHFRQKRYGEGIQEIDRAIALAPQEPRYCVFKALSFGFQGQDRAALAEFDRCIELDPNDPLTWRNRGVSKRRLGDLQGALSDQNRAVQLDPKGVDNLLARASTYRQLRRMDEARSDLNALLAIRPDHAGARALMAEIDKSLVAGKVLAPASAQQGSGLHGTAGETQAVSEMKGRLQKALASSWSDHPPHQDIIAACRREGSNFSAYGQTEAGVALIQQDLNRVQRRIDAMRLVYQTFYDLRTTANRRSVEQANALISQLRDKFVQDAVTQVTTVVLMPTPVTEAGMLTLEIHNALVDLLGHPVTGQDGHVQDAAQIAGSGRRLQQLDGLVRRYDAQIRSLVPEIRRLQQVRALLNDCAGAFAARQTEPSAPKPVPIKVDKVVPLPAFRTGQILLRHVYLQERRTTRTGTTTVMGGSKTIGNYECPAKGVMNGRSFQGRFACELGGGESVQGELSITVGADAKSIDAFSLKATRRYSGLRATTRETLSGRPIPADNRGSLTSGAGVLSRALGGQEACQFIASLSFEQRDDDGGSNMNATGHECRDGTGGSTSLGISLRE